MKAAVKCTQCGAEITNLNFSWGRKQFLFIIPLILISLVPLWRLYKPKANYLEDLRVTLLEKRTTDHDLKGTLEILGTIENSGKTSWSRIELNAEFFSPDGKFVDEASKQIIHGSVEAGAGENFKMEIIRPSAQVRSETTRMELKIVDAYTSPF